MNMTAGDPGADGSFNSHNNPDSINPLLTSDRALIQRQREVMKMQDEMLVDIEKGVDRLHTQVSHLSLFIFSSCFCFALKKICFNLYLFMLTH